jgi:hypothetical protein
MYLYLSSYVPSSEHKLVVDQLSKLEDTRKAFRLVGGVLVERTVGEVLPVVNENYLGVRRHTMTVRDVVLVVAGKRAK